MNLYKKIFSLVLSIIAVVLLSFTSQSYADSPLSVSSPTATNITSSTVKVNAIVDYGGNAPLSQVGFCIGSNPDPALGTAPCLPASGGLNGGTISLTTGVAPNTTYHFRGYASNGSQTAYSPDVTFTSLSAPTATPIPIPTATPVIAVPTPTTVPPTPTPQSSAGQYSVTWGTDNVPTSMTTGTKVYPVINITNSGTATWTAANPHFAYHWANNACSTGNALTTNGIYTWDGIRTPLPSNVAPGASIALDTAGYGIAAPAAAGTYCLMYDMVKEGDCWFGGVGGSCTGAPTKNTTITVTGAATCTLKPQGDANCNNVVDSADYDIWKQEFTGALATKTADFNNDGTVNLLDFNIWKTKILGALVPTPTITTAVTNPTSTPVPVGIEPPGSATVTPASFLPGRSSLSTSGKSIDFTRSNSTPPATAYTLWVGSARRANDSGVPAANNIDYGNINLTDTTSGTINAPTTGPLYITLWSQVNGTMYPKDYTY